MTDDALAKAKAIIDEYHALGVMDDKLTMLQALVREVEAGRAYIDYMDRPGQEHDFETMVEVTQAYSAARKGKA